MQIGRAGERVAVRVVQRKKAKGTLTKSMRTTPVPGGFDVRIEDNAGVTTVAPSAAATATFDRGAALSKIVGEPLPLPAPVAAAVVPAAAAPTVSAVAPLPHVAAAPLPHVALGAPTPALGDVAIDGAAPPPFSRKNAAPPPPATTTSAMTINIIGFLPFFGSLAGASDMGLGGTAAFAVPDSTVRVPSRGAAPRRA